MVYTLHPITLVWRQEALCELEASLVFVASGQRSYIVQPCLKKRKVHCMSHLECSTYHLNFSDVLSLALMVDLLIIADKSYYSLLN